MDELLKKMNYKKGAAHVAYAPGEFSPIIERWRTESEVVELAEPEPEAKDHAFSFLLVFAASESEVKAKIPPLAPHVGPGTVFWVAFPKKTSPKYDSDINRDILWKLMEPMGFKPNRNVAIDEDWSALRFAPL